MSPRRRDSYAWWEYAIMAGVVLLAVGGAYLLFRLVADGGDAEGPVPMPSPSTTCAPDLWRDPASGACLPRTECPAPELYEEETNTCRVAAPQVVSVSPRGGRASGGTVLTITGFDFQPGTTVAVGGVPAVETSVINSNTIVTRTPPGSSFAPLDVTVTNPDGQSDVLDNIFTYAEPKQQRITEIVPDTGSTAGGEAIVIKGRDFVDGAVVSFNGRVAPEVEVLSPTTLRVIIPGSYAGPASVNVRNPGEETETLKGAFTYVDRDPRLVERVRPNDGPAAGGTRITIIGSGFEPGATVDVGGNSARQVEVVSSTRITARTPVGKVGTADVAVRNPGVPAAILRDGFTYVEAPTITAVSPKRGPVEGGTRITITGTGFAEGAVVTIGDVTVTDARVIDESTIRLVTPAAAEPIVVAITVTNPGEPTTTLRRGFAYRLDTAVEPTPSPTAAEPASLPRCASFRVPGASTSPGTGLVLTDADLFPAGRDLVRPTLIDAGLAQGGGSITWQASPPRIEWSAPAGATSSSVITYAYQSASCRGFGTGTVTVSAR